MPSNRPAHLFGEEHLTLRRSHGLFVNFGAARVRQHLVDATAAHNISA
jgi:hypothetical protein